MRVRSALVALAVVGGIVGAPAAAYAAPSAGEPVPVALLDGCSSSWSDPARGGWAIKTFRSEAANAPVGWPVRPRSVSLGEPCIDEVLGDDFVTVPMNFQEVPLGDWDGDDDGLPGVPGGAEGDGWAQYPIPWAGSNTPQLFVSPGPQAVAGTQVLTATYSTSTGTGSAQFQARYWCDDSTTSYVTDVTGGTVAAGVSDTFTVVCSTGQLYAISLQSTTTTVGAGLTPTQFISTYPLGNTNSRGWWLASELPPGSVDTVAGFASSHMEVGGTRGSAVTSLHCSSGSITGTGVVVSDFSQSGPGPSFVSIPWVDGGSPQWSWLQYYNGGFDWEVASCDRIELIELLVCVWVENQPEGHTCYLNTWVPGTSHPYQEDPPDEYMCSSPGWTPPECYEVLNPPYIDPGDFDSVCAGAPDFESPGWDVAQYVPAFVGWVTGAIGHYAHCLFYPQGGWDRDGLISDELEASGAGQLEDAAIELVGAFEYGQSCGTIIDLGDGAEVFDGGTIDTCEWTDWAVPMRAVFAAALWIGFAFWLVRFVIRTVLGVFSRQGVPDPLEEESAP